MNTETLGGTTMITAARHDIHQDEAGNLYAEASSIGLRAGEWPDAIAVPMLGGGTLIFDRSHFAMVNVEGDLEGYRYFGRDNVHTITVFND